MRILVWCAQAVFTGSSAGSASLRGDLTVCRDISLLYRTGHMTASNILASGYKPLVRGGQIMGADCKWRDPTRHDLLWHGQIPACRHVPVNGQIAKSFPVCAISHKREAFDRLDKFRARAGLEALTPFNTTLSSICFLCDHVFAGMTIAGQLIWQADGTPCAMKMACTVWGGGKPGDSIKGFPVTVAKASFVSVCLIHSTYACFSQVNVGRWCGQQP